MNAPVDPQPLAELMQTAANILMGQAAADGAALDLLARLEYRDTRREDAPHRAAMLRAAARFQRIFSLRSDDSPGLVALGAEVDPGIVGVRDGPTGGVSGAGVTFRQAFESCVGEGVEFVSQFATPEDEPAQLTDAQALANATPALRELCVRLRPYRRDPDASHTDWIKGADLADGRPVWLPADLCLRRPISTRELDPPWPLGIGCGAGTTPLDATLHAVMELIERDAVALWWRGSAPPRPIPPGPGAPLLGRLRGQATQRRTWLLDITSDAAVPVVVAVSSNDDGFGLCYGHACRPTLASAADAACMELAQMELAYRIAATKRQVRGDAALNDTDRQHIHRYTGVNVAATPALHPLAPPAAPCDLLSHDKITLLAALRKRLQAIGAEAYAVNLTRPALGIPVARAVAPGLEVGLTSPPGPRLRARMKHSLQTE